jgi:hypothetical protein
MNGLAANGLAANGLAAIGLAAAEETRPGVGSVAPGTLRGTLELAGADALGHPPEIGPQHDRVHAVGSHQREGQRVGEQLLEGFVLLARHGTISGCLGRDREP